MENTPQNNNNNNNNNNKVFIHKGRVYPCIGCRNSYINLEFLHKHQNKCLKKNIFSLMTCNLFLKRNYEKLHNSDELNSYESNNFEIADKFDLPDIMPQICLEDSEKTLSLTPISSFSWQEEGPQHFLLSSQDNQKRLNKTSKKLKYGCDECGKYFQVPSHLKHHMRTHTGEKPFQCPACPKRFALPGNLRNHLTTHTPEKRYLCPECHKGFSSENELNRHIKNHLKQRTHECHICHKKFSQLWNLTAHQRVHTNIRPYPCNLCDKSFKQLAHLNKHMSTHCRT